ncbi:helix-turn-helix domain-containing protein [Paraburkholderia pallida]|uniref:XRE family transcriptional regulator n=1 Tax=Paraburkholderia pallida TaxID=2547399 RepID=A0A4P7CJQ9_9BURK|nr:helix-turn-helix transcriptional regulator [Paraburkholderia pallida]QBQ95925.1 XRE family transcriptional regulator [Paraburkholderia pallida]
MAAINEEKFATMLGRALAKARNESGLTQEEVANRLGVDPQTISRQERGANWPTLPRLIAFANLYAIPVATLLTPPSSHAQDLTGKLNEQLSKLDAEDRAWALHLMSDVCARLAKPRAQRKS